MLVSTDLVLSSINVICTENGATSTTYAMEYNGNYQL